jgi:hypothetical protein
MRISTNHDQECLLKSLSDALHPSSYVFGSLSVLNLIISQGRTEVNMKLTQRRESARYEKISIRIKKIKILNA